MKKLLLAIALVISTATSTWAAGTISPLNGPVRRIALDFNHDGVADRLATAADGIKMGVFYGTAGPSASELVAYPQFAVIGDYDGIFTGLPGVLQIPGTHPQDIISLQMRFSDSHGLQAETPVIQTRLGPDEGPGTVVWGGGESRFHSAVTLSSPGFAIVIVPEPSTLALGAMAVVLAGFRLSRRRK